MRLPNPAAGRTFGPDRLAPVEHPGLQKVLADALSDGNGGFVAGADPRTHPSPENPYARLINAGGPALPGRATNRFDAAISALSSFLGNPQVAAPRHADGGPGLYTHTDEHQGYLRAAQWLGTGPNHFDPALPIPQQFTNLHTWVHHLGPGAASLAFRVVPEIDPRTGTIARDPQNHPVTSMQPLVVVYPPGADGPVWWDPVTGETWDHPPASAVATTARLGFLVIPPGRTVDPPAAPPAAGSSTTDTAPRSPAGRDGTAAAGTFEPLREPSGNAGTEAESAGTKRPLPEPRPDEPAAKKPLLEAAQQVSSGHFPRDSGPHRRRSRCRGSRCGYRCSHRYPPARIRRRGWPTPRTAGASARVAYAWPSTRGSRRRSRTPCATVAGIS
jgi:hypothetical protein